MTSTRPFRLKGPFTIELYDDTPAVIFTEDAVINQDLLVTKAEPVLDEDNKGAKRVMYHNVECEYEFGEYNPADVQAVNNDAVKKVVATFSNQGKHVDIDNVLYSYTSMEKLTPKLIFGLKVIGADWTTAFDVQDVV